MITELKKGKIIVTLETPREIELIKAALGSVTYLSRSKTMDYLSIPQLERGEIDPAIVLYNRLVQLG